MRIPAVLAPKHTRELSDLTSGVHADAFHWLHAAAASGQVRCCDDALAIATCALRPQAPQLQQRLLQAMASATQGLTQQPKERGAAKLLVGMLAKLAHRLLLPQLDGAA